VLWRVLTFAGFNNDHYVHLAGAQQILLGEWPVRDFVDVATPLMFVVHAAAQVLFGPALGVEQAIVAVGFAVGAVCTVVVAARLSGSVTIALLMTAFEIAIYPRSFGYPKVLLYAAAALVIMAMARRFTALTLVATAVTIVVAFLFRHDHGVFIGIASVTAILVGCRHDGWRVGVRRSLALTGVSLLLVLPWLLFVQANGGVAAYVSLSLSAARGEAVGNALRGLPGLRLDDLASERNALAWLFYLFHALPLVCVFVLVRRRGEPERWPGETAVVAALTAMAIPVNVTFIRGTVDGRVQDAIVPAALLGSWLLGLAWDRSAGRTPLAVAAGVVAITAWALVPVGAVRDNLSRTDLLHGSEILGMRIADLWSRLGRRLPERDHVPSRYGRALLPFIGYMGRCTAPEDRLLVTDLFPEINVMAQRGFAGGHWSYRPEFYTSVADQQQTVARLEKQSVPFVVSTRRLAQDLTKQMPILFAYIERRFELMAHVPVGESPGVDVLVERGRRAVRVDEATGWPCFR
jgi:hypothetical protein